jgi:hypothetical protein
MTLFGGGIDVPPRAPPELRKALPREVEAAKAAKAAKEIPENRKVSGLRVLELSIDSGHVELLVPVAGGGCEAVQTFDLRLS